MNPCDSRKQLSALSQALEVRLTRRIASTDSGGYNRSKSDVRRGEGNRGEFLLSGIAPA
jgi:hypothetical protein